MKNNQNFKSLPLRISLFVLLMFMVAVLAAAAAPGSADDPLVTKSWVDSYVNEAFSDVEAQIADIRSEYTSRHICLYIGIKDASVNGASMKIDTAPKIMGAGYTMVPIRFIAEALDIDVEWVGSERKVIFTDGKKKMTLKIGSTTATIDGASYTMNIAPIIENDRTLVHIRFVAEAFGCSVDWTGGVKRIDIYR